MDQQAGQFQLIWHNTVLTLEAFGECASACARIFLGGKSRKLADGAKLGFHRPWIVKERERRLYEANRVEGEVGG